MKLFNKKCLVCGTSFKTQSNVSKYCSDNCRKQSTNERQKQFMKEKRKKIKEEKSINRRSFTNTDFKKATNIDYFDPIQKKMNKALKMKDFKTYYELYKKRILDNETEWGIVGRHIVSGIEVHEENFVELVLEKINQ